VQEDVPEIAVAPARAARKAPARKAAATKAPAKSAPATPVRPGTKAVKAVKAPAAQASGRAAAKAAAPAAKAPAKAAAGSRAGSVVVIPDRGKFHKGECRFVRGVEGTETMSKSVASRAGYTACGVCKP
jgi:hypothetical protein